MNQDWQEKRIKRLFDEMRQDDERLAPAFTTISKAAVSRQAGRPIVRRLVFAGVVVILLAGSALFLKSRLSRQVVSVDVALTSPLPNENRDRDVPPPSKRNAGPVLDTPPRLVGHRAGRERRGAAGLVSQWRSPTDFLLDVPGSQLLRTVPSVGQSTNLKVNFPDLNN